MFIEFSLFVLWSDHGLFFSLYNCLGSGIDPCLGDPLGALTAQHALRKGLESVSVVEVDCFGAFPPVSSMVDQHSRTLAVQILFFRRIHHLRNNVWYVQTGNDTWRVGWNVPSLRGTHPGRVCWHSKSTRISLPLSTVLCSSLLALLQLWASTNSTNAYLLENPVTISRTTVTLFRAPCLLKT